MRMSASSRTRMKAAILIHPARNSRRSTGFRTSLRKDAVRSSGFYPAPLLPPRIIPQIPSKTHRTTLSPPPLLVSTLRSFTIISLPVRRCPSTILTVTLTGTIMTRVLCTRPLMLLSSSLSNPRPHILRILVILSPRQKTPSLTTALITPIEETRTMMILSL